MYKIDVYIYIYIVCLQRVHHKTQKIIYFYFSYIMRQHVSQKFAEIKPKCLIGMVLMIAHHCPYQPPQQAVDTAWHSYSVPLVGSRYVIKTGIIWDPTGDSLQVLH